MIVDRVTGQPATAYTPPEDCIAVGQPTSGVCRRCGAPIRYVGQSHPGDRPLWQATTGDGSLHCPGLPFGDDWHEPFGQRMDWQ